MSSDGAFADTSAGAPVGLPVGIIANPASGKDIRRLVAHATTVDNQGKVNIVRRVLIGLAAMGVRQVWVMPDPYRLCDRAQEGLSHLRDLPTVQLLDMPTTGRSEDSEQAARLLRELGVGCIVSLGGDGTVRVVSKGAGDVPLLPISTGTNNVLPSFVEGTIAGLAAGALARGLVPLEAVAHRHKWIELSVNGQVHERALVDVAVLAGQFVGARAVWDVEDLRQVLVTRASPASIGISAIIGAARPVGVAEPVGVSAIIAADGAQRVLAAIGPGLVAEVGIAALRVVEVGAAFDLVSERPLIFALDGEREVVLYPADTASIVLRADGPWIVDSERTMVEMARLGHLTWLQRAANPGEG